MKQPTFASMSFAAKKRRTRQEKLLAEMEQVLPWSKLVAVIEPHYPKAERAARKAGVYWGVSLKAAAKRKLTGANKRTNRRRSSTRARVEHIFRVIKRQFGYMKVRYRGLAKNAARAFSLIGLTNLYLARRQPMVS